MRFVLQFATQSVILYIKGTPKPINTEVILMATKTANVTARIQPEIKEQAEAVLAQIGIPVSVLIDTLYRQIILTGGIPYSLSVPRIQTLDSMTPEQFDTMMQKGIDEAKAGIGFTVEEAFKKIREDI